jgi:1-acyl-sn-glycerol-3-phosphate acyltransferase
VIYLRSILFTIIFILSVLVFSGVVVISGLFSRETRFKAARGWSTFNLWLLRVICGLDYEIEGRENIPGENCVVLTKHQSTFETVAGFQLFPTICWVLKRELMWIPVLGWALSVIESIPINRKAHGTAVRQVVRIGKKRLAEGFWVFIFPEGTRMAPGTTRRYGISGALLARDAGRQIVPIAHNAGDYWPRRGLRKKPGTIRIVIGPPVDTAGKKPDAINLEVQEWMENTMRRISAGYDKVGTPDDHDS